MTPTTSPLRAAARIVAVAAEARIAQLEQIRAAALATDALTPAERRTIAREATREILTLVRFTVGG